MKQSELCNALGLSKAQVSKLVARGMPTESAEAAEHWRRKNLDPSMTSTWSAKRGTGRAAPAEARNPIDIITTSILPRMFFLMDAKDVQGLEPITETVRAAAPGLDDSEVLRVLVALADRYARVIDDHMGCCDGRVNLPAELQ